MARTAPLFEGCVVFAQIVDLLVKTETVELVKRRKVKAKKGQCVTETKRSPLRRYDKDFEARRNGRGLWQAWMNNLVANCGK